METQVLNGRVALVTGGTSGIGFGSARRLIEEGALVYITGRRQAQLDDAAAKLGPSAFPTQAVATSKVDMLRVADAIKTGHGRLDILFANAGRDKPMPSEELAEEQIDRELAVNLKGVILTVQSMLGVLVDGASVVLNASITCDMGLPGFGVYAATKAAVLSLAHSWTSGLRSRSIRVNTISPGTIPTEAFQTEQGMSEAEVAAYATRVAAEIPAGHVGTPEDIGNALVFLASDAGK